jgi:murein L,D-transpeptidase YafK
MVVGLLLAAAGCGLLGTREPEALLAPPAATLAGKVIRRHPTVERAIESTRSVALEAGRGDRRLVAWKAARCLQVVDASRVVRTFPISLGGRPEGAKEREGDGRTPEGRYVLIPHHGSAQYGSSFYACYPNADDAERGVRDRLMGPAARARILRSLERGARPDHATALGGMILVHGTKRRQDAYLTITDWTDGGIVMENAHLEALLAAYGPRDRPVLEIRP